MKTETLLNGMKICSVKKMAIWVNLGMYATNDYDLSVFQVLNMVFHLFPL